MKINMLKQKLAAIFLIVAGILTVKVLQDATFCVIGVPAGIGLLLTHKQILEFD